jgi:hypothetical protein
VEVVIIEKETMMLSVSAETGGLEDTDFGGQAGSSIPGTGSKPADANERRGSWGNLWD